MKLIISIIFACVAGITSLQAQSVKNYRVTVAFNSIGTGVPNNKPLISYINKFKKTYKIKAIIAEQIGPLGREGEYKLGFMLKEMNKSRQALFIKGLTNVVATMKDRGMAELAENDQIDFASLGRASATIKKF